MHNLITVLLICAIVFNGIMYLMQPSMIFFPYTELDETPADWGFDYEVVNLTAKDNVRLHAWYIPYHGATKTLLFFHGNAGNISHRGASVEIFHRLGLNVLIFDYRGYGHSQGKPDESGFYLDARAAWRFLIEQKGVTQEQIILFGRSLGGVIAAELAAEVQPAGLILESAFSSSRDMAEAVFPILSRLIYQRFEFDTVRHISRVRCPVLVLHSPDDTIIPYRLGEKVYQAANEPKSLVQLKGDHNNGFMLSQPDYERALADFIFGDRDTVQPLISDEGGTESQQL